MKYLYLTILFYFFSMISYSQGKSIIGEIKNKDEQTFLEYVNIGILNKGIGTVSSSQGVFTLKLNGNEKANDTVIFSRIGFKTIKKLLLET